MYGDNAAPIFPTVIHSPRATPLMFVANNSPVKVFVDEKADATPTFPIIERTNEIHAAPEIAYIVYIAYDPAT